MTHTALAVNALRHSPYYANGWGFLFVELYSHDNETQLYITDEADSIIELKGGWC